MSVRLFPHQQTAVEKLDSGSILCGGVGTGKSITALTYFFVKECGSRLLIDGSFAEPLKKVDLYIITTARKRDTKEWLNELAPFPDGYLKAIDSWNNIEKYTDVESAFFIFDEQRVVGYGAWVKSFLRIAKKNRWILLSATPGDTWLDYIPVFIANGFYKNRTEFLARHAVYSRYTKYPKVDKFVDIGRLEMLRRKITVSMPYAKKTTPHYIDVGTTYDILLYERVCRDRWNPYDNEPIRDISQACYLMRKVVNSDQSRLSVVKDLMAKHSRLIIFYNYDYELEMLLTLAYIRPTAQWNGHKHEPIPDSTEWLYLVQYAAGSEGWNCILTDAVIFFSQSYSYKQMTQAAGRIDRLNTPFTDLYYYTIKTTAPIDKAVSHALKSKKNFNEMAFLEQLKFA